MKAWMGLNFDGIPPLTAELGALGPIRLLEL